MKPSKCYFMKKEVKLLEHIVSAAGMKPDKEKIKSVKEFPIPRTVKEVRSFLKLTGYYRKLIKDYVKIARPIFELVKESTKFEWKQKQQETFEKLKLTLTQEPVVTYPNFNKMFYLMTDRSAIGLKTVLAKKDKKERERVTAYASRKTKDIESRYSSIELELLTVVWAINKFYKYLIWKLFVLITDYSILKYIKGNPMIWKGRISRWVYNIQ